MALHDAQLCIVHHGYCTPHLAPQILPMKPAVKHLNKTGMSRTRSLLLKETLHTNKAGSTLQQDKIPLMATAPRRPEVAAEGAEVQRLRDENAALHDALQALALATLPEELHNELRAGALGACLHDHCLAEPCSAALRPNQGHPVTQLLCSCSRVLRGCHHMCFMAYSLRAVWMWHAVVHRTRPHTMHSAQRHTSCHSWPPADACRIATHRRARKQRSRRGPARHLGSCGSGVAAGAACCPAAGCLR